MTGIEPASPAWEASVLPMNYICKNNVNYQNNSVNKENSITLFFKIQRFSSLYSNIFFKISVFFIFGN